MWLKWLSLAKQSFDQGLTTMPGNSLSKVTTSKNRETLHHFRCIMLYRYKQLALSDEISTMNGTTSTRGLCGDCQWRATQCDSEEALMTMYRGMDR